MKKRMILILVALFMGILVTFTTAQNNLLKTKTEFSTTDDTQSTITQYEKNNVISKQFGKNIDNFKLNKIENDTESKSAFYSYIAPTGIDVDAQGNMYIIDPSAQQIQVYDKEGKSKKILTYEKLNKNKYVQDFGVSRKGKAYILFDDSVYQSDSINESFTEYASGFKNAHQINIGNSGDVSILDFNNDDLRVQRFNENGELVSIREQYGYHMGIFDYAGVLGNIINVIPSGGNCYEELQYILTNTAYPEKEFGISFKASKDYLIQGISIIGIDDNDNIYFLRKMASTNPSKEITEYFLDKYTFDSGKIVTKKLDNNKMLPVENLTKHVYKVDYAGKVYQLQTDDTGVNVVKYKID